MGSPAAPSLREIVPALVLFLLVPGAARALPLFPNPLYAVGNLPYSVVSADLNGDGRPDLITVNNWTGDLSVLLARERGEFAPEVRVAVEHGSVAAATGDFNGDGKPDLVVCSTDAPSNLAILLGRGDGSFLPPAFVFSPGDCADIVVADFNNDHKADVAMLGGNYLFVTVLLGKGDGTFSSGSGAGAVYPVSTAMAVGDFNQDGKPDLVVGMRAEDHPELTAGTVALFLGNGDGSFTPGVIVSTQSGVLDLVAADFNRDGKPDLATLNAGAILSVILGRGDGTFQAPGYSSAESSVPRALIAGDFDSDNRIDLAVTDVQLNSALVFLGRGDGTFGLALRSVTGKSPGGLLSGDFDGDGRIDLVTSNLSNSVTILSGQGDGTFGPPLRSAVGQCPVALAQAGDFNGDEEPDLAVVNRCSNDASILLGRGDGRFEPQARYGTGTGPYTAVIADFNGDGTPDLAVANGSSQDISIRLGLGDGSFGSESRISLPSAPGSLVTGDFNRDGRPDLAVACPRSNHIQILLGLGDGFFAPPLSTSMTMVGLLAVDDFNGDGIPDLAATGADLRVVVLAGRGDGTFTAPPPPGPAYIDGPEATALAAADLDGDGKPDAVLTVGGQAGFGYLLFFRGRGDGSFEAPAEFLIEAYPWAVAIGDFDLDRRKDIAVAEGYANAILILKNLGGGMFAPSERFLAGDTPSNLLAVDLNGDGWTDLVSTNQSGGDVLAVLNRGIAGVVPNRPPVADAGADATLECASPSGTAAHLDGSGSSDPDSTPGSNDDIVLLQWFEGFGGPSPVLLGTSAKLTVTLPLGVHTITLRVTDAAGASATDTVVITVADTTPPDLSVSVSPAVLWPPNGRMVDIQTKARGSDACGPFIVVVESILENESACTPGATCREGGDIQVPGSGTAWFALRAARSGSETGRTYVVTYRATDTSGNVTRSTTTVLVPHDRGDIAPGSLRSSRSRPAVPPRDPARLQEPTP
jgi:VCBS repeat protein/FG-GAP repeat protein